MIVAPMVDSAADGSAVLPEHCFFCFEVLSSALEMCEEPKAAPFHDDGQERYVAVLRTCSG